MDAVAIRAQFWDALSYQYAKDKPAYLNSRKKAIKRRLSDIEQERGVLDALLKTVEAAR